uniref:zinc finger protein 567 isoform X2 n=1 Tax=Scatophagus argus TaxID=75038 RepID=UPI001ED8367A|nr:zinc finger protein 567 isoform X2 [Scatophagus argus]
MADFSSRVLTSTEHLPVGGSAAGKATSSSVVSGNGNWDGAGGMDQITVVRIDDTHIAEERSHVGGKFKDGSTEYFEVMEYSMPAEEEVVGEEEEDSVYVIEYSNPEEEGESYQFTMSVDRSLPTKKPVIKHPVFRENTRSPLPVMSKPPRPSRPRHEIRQKRKTVTEEEVDKEEVMSNKSVLELGENYRDMMEMNSGPDKRLVCLLCPPPGRIFKRGSGLAVHLKQMHHMVEKKTFFCTSCQQSVRTQIELDAHTKRHANQDAVFTCLICAAETENKTDSENTGFRGSKLGLKSHLEKKHPGVIPRCDICNKGFKSLVSYLADQFRHVGRSPYYCAKCQIYEMTERGLSVHMKNHDKKMKKQECVENHLQTVGVSAIADNSATDDSDF